MEPKSGSTTAGRPRVSDPYAPAPELVALAGRWATYLGASERTGRRVVDGRLVEIPPVEVAVLRCTACHDEVYPADISGVLAHLMAGHGYRMDGRQYDNRNRLIGDAREHEQRD